MYTNGPQDFSQLKNGIPPYKNKQVMNIIY